MFLSPEYLRSLDHVALRAKTDCLLNRSVKTLSNWAESHACHIAALFRPRTVDHVQLVVERTRRDKKQLRCFGARHSPSDLALVNDGYMMSLEYMQDVVSIDQSSRRMTVQGGIVLKKLIRIAYENGLAMPNLGSISDQTIAGAISTATHGCGLKYSCISHYVSCLTLVLADGSTVSCSKDDKPDLFNASRCALGTTGVIVEVTIDLEPAFNLHEQVFSMQLGDFIDAVTPTSDPSNKQDIFDGEGSILAAAEHIRCWWFPHIDEVRISAMNRSIQSATRPTPWYQRLVFDGLIGKTYNEFALYLGTKYPRILASHCSFMWALYFTPEPLAISLPSTVYSFLPSFLKSSSPRIVERPAKASDSSDMRLEWWTPSSSSRTLHRVDRSDLLFNYDCGPHQYTFEGCVPIHRVQEALRALDDWMKGEAADRLGLRHHFPIEIRPVEADEVWLAPTYHTRVVYIGVVMYKPYNIAVDYERFFARFERIIKQFEGKPHWAKAHHYTSQQLTKIYPRFKDFLRVREEVDPTGLFLNPYTKRHLLGIVSADTDQKQFLV